MATPERLHSPEQAAHWLRGQVRAELRTDSRQIGAGDGLIAWPGAATDARRHVPAALAAGASACLVEDEGVDAFHFDDTRVRAYRGLKAASGPIAAHYYGQPSQQLPLVAITGTNGKTSTAWWLAQALSQHGRCGVVGTLGIGQPPELAYNGLTTPDPVLLQQWLRRFVDGGFTACAIEASSIGLAEHRLDGCALAVAVFTNFTQDHLDYHGSMAAYWAAKAALFRWPGLKAAVVNVDDPHGAALAAELAGSGLDLWTVSCQGPARLQAQAITQGPRGLRFEVREAGGAAVHVLDTQAIGAYNVANLLGAIGAMRALGLALADAVAACENLLPVPGRMECVGEPGQPLVVVDYAHTPDALAQTLDALRPVAQARGGRLWCVFGCGGDRDASKRPLMAAAAEQRADALLLTSDNPRSEDPATILAQVRAGLQGTGARVVPDRAEAIATAVLAAAAADVVLVAGKGHEAYQEVAGVRHPFSDQAEARRALAKRPATLTGASA